jgi:hypothetical protein
MRTGARTLFALLALSVLLASPRKARAESGVCRDGVLAVTGETTVEVLHNCGYPTYAKLYPATNGRYRQKLVEVWIYDLGEGSFPRVLRFVEGVLEEVKEISRLP